MLNRSIAYIFAFLVVMAWTSGASVSPFHHHHEKKSPVMKSHEVGHDCPVNHHRIGLPCPHAQGKRDLHEYHIASDCGGSPTTSIPTSNGFSKNLFSVSDSFLIKGDDQTDGFIFKTPRYKFSLSFLIDHPPKSL